MQVEFISPIKAGPLSSPSESFVFRFFPLNLLSLQVDNLENKLEKVLLFTLLGKGFVHVSRYTIR